MDLNFANCLAFTLKEEGGYGDDPRDPGGATDRGVTLATLTRWRQDHGEPTPPLSDLQNISAAEVKAIYGSMFWNTVNGAQLPLGVDHMVFDHGVTSGPGTSARLLQSIIHLPADQIDGYIGPITLEAVSLLTQGSVINAVYGVQKTFYRQCSAFATFGDGWLARLDRRAALALTMAGVTP